MNNLLAKRIIRILQLMAGMVLVVVIFGNGCSNGGFKSNEMNYDLSSNSLQCTSATSINVIPGTKTVSFVSAGQILGHLSNCVGLVVPSDSTLSVYNEKKGSISTYGAANTITPPMMMAITSIAGEICSDLIDQEISKGLRMFSGFNFSSSTLPSDSQLQGVISNLALSCWQENETNDERNILIENVVQSIGASETNAARKAALMLCTSMLSSVNALLN